MGLYHSPRIVTNGLVLALDAADRNSYVSGSTTWYDLSGNGNDFILQGNITWDAVNGFGNFTGNSTGNGNKFYCVNSNFAKALKTANGGVGYTTIVFAKCTTSGVTWQKLIGQSDSENYIDLYARASSTTYWQEDGSTIYVDKNQVAINTYILANTGFHMLSSTNINGGTTTTPTTTFSIGNEPNGSSVGNNAYPWYGNIAIVQVYNRVLSLTEIQQNYNALKSRFGI
jgi:hypothetical protein